MTRTALPMDAIGPFRLPLLRVQLGSCPGEVAIIRVRLCAAVPVGCLAAAARRFVREQARA